MHGNDALTPEEDLPHLDQRSREEQAAEVGENHTYEQDEVREDGGGDRPLTGQKRRSGSVSIDSPTVFIGDGKQIASLAHGRVKRQRNHRGALQLLLPCLSHSRKNGRGTDRG